MGTSRLNNYTGGGTKSDIMFTYIEVPANFVYHIPVGIGKVYFGAGPYYAVPVSGKIVNTYTYNGNVLSSTDHASFGSGMNDYKTSDYGINIIGGLSFKYGLSLNLGYGIGLVNISNYPGESLKNRVLSTSLGFLFF